MVEFEDVPIDTFRFMDGAVPGQTMTGLVSVNGAVDSDAGVHFAVSDGSGMAFSSDALPDPFPMTSAMTEDITVVGRDGEMVITLLPAGLEQAD